MPTSLTGRAVVVTAAAAFALVVFVVATIAVGNGSGGSTAGSRGVGSTPAPIASPTRVPEEVGLERDNSANAGADGRPIEEMGADIDGQNEFGFAATELRTHHGDSFAEAYWRWGEGEKPILTFRGQPSAEALALIDGLPMPVVVETNAPLTEPQRIAVTSGAFNAFIVLFPGVVAFGGLEPGTATVAITTSTREAATPEAEEAARESARAALPEGDPSRALIDVRIEYSPDEWQLG